MIWIYLAICCLPSWHLHDPLSIFHNVPCYCYGYQCPVLHIANPYVFILFIHISQTCNILCSISLLILIIDLKLVKAQHVIYICIWLGCLILFTAGEVFTNIWLHCWFKRRNIYASYVVISYTFYIYKAIHTLYLPSHRYSAGTSL